MGGNIGVFPQTTTTTLDNNQATTTTNQYNDGGFVDVQPACTAGAYPSYSCTWSPTQQVALGRVTSTNTTDYNGSTLKTVQTQYQYQQNAAYKTANFLDAIYSFTILNGSGTQVAQATYGYDENNGSPQGTYGHQTSITRWLNGGTSPRSQVVYNTQGMDAKKIDAKNNTTTITYDSTGLFPQTIQLPDTVNSAGVTIHHIENYRYDPIGLLSSHTDQNSQTTSYSYDSMSRLTRVVYPPDIHGTQGEVDLHYPDAISVEKTEKIDSTHLTDSWTLFDGLGRVSRTAVFNDQQGANVWDQVDTCYDGLGNKRFESYPYQSTGFGSTKVCSSSGQPGDAFTYDTLGRILTVMHSDSSVLTTNYTGPATQVSDEGNGSLNEQKIFQHDALNRLTNVCEVSSGTLMGNGGTPAACGLQISGTGFLTSYTYDALGNVKSVVQGNQTRNFTYDSLSRLLCSSDPEISSIACPDPDNGIYTSGTMRYSYDANGNTLVTTRPKANQSGTVATLTHYSYDALNRLLTKTYTDVNNNPDSTGSNATLNYDESSVWGKTLGAPIGRLTSEYNAANTRSAFSYDNLGRVLDDYQCAPSTCGTSLYDLHYDYDLASDVISATNGQGVTFTSTYNRSKELTSMSSSLSDANHPAALISNITYGASGRIFATYGNGLTEERFYSPRGQLQNKWLGTLSNGSLTNLVYSFGLDIASDGNVTRGNDSVNGNWGYSYDQFNRLYASANVNGTTYSYVYDRYGNRWQQNGPTQVSLTFSSNNNRVDGYNYDAVGNMACTVSGAGCNSLGGHVLTFDVDGRVTAVDSGNTASYVYDADGRRVRITIPGESAWNNVECLYDLGGHCITKTNYSNQGWSMGEVYAAGEHIAIYNSGTTFFTYGDWLGTERYRTYPNGTYAESCTGLPFGDALSCPDDGAISPLHMTGKERDDETGLDYFGARYYGSYIARFMSVDPLNAGADFSTPQSWNGYAYVDNNPTNSTDPNGLAKKVCYEQDIYGGKSCYWEGEHNGEYDKKQKLYWNAASREWQKDDPVPINQNFRASGAVIPLGLGPFDLALPLMRARGLSAVATTTAVVDRAVVGEVAEASVKAGELELTETMSKTALRKLTTDIAKSGIKNKVIKYVQVNGRKFVVSGNNRLIAARRLGLDNQLTLEEVKLPFAGFKSEADVIESYAELQSKR